MARSNGYCDEHLPKGSFGGKGGPGVHTRWGDSTNNPFIPEVGQLKDGHQGTNWLGTETHWT